MKCLDRATRGIWCNHNIQKQRCGTPADTCLFWACADRTCAGAKASPCFCRGTNHAIAYRCLAQAVPDLTQEGLVLMQRPMLACAVVSLRNYAHNSATWRRYRVVLVLPGAAEVLCCTHALSQPQRLFSIRQSIVSCIVSGMGQSLTTAKFASMPFEA